VDLILLTLPDYSISGVRNVRLLEVAKQVWPKSHTIVIADNPQKTKELYSKGADYVVATTRLSSERIADMLQGHYSSISGGLARQLSPSAQGSPQDSLARGELKDQLERHRRNEEIWEPNLISLEGKG
jgi:voltage-gated potassium channel Kch